MKKRRGKERPVRSIPWDWSDPPIVHGDGPVPADIMVVGEAPGVDEAESVFYRRQPPHNFIGASGRVNWAIVRRYAGMSRDQFFVTNMVRTPLPGNRDPTRREVNRWTRLLEKDLRRVRPRIVVTLGRYSTAWFLGRALPMETVHGVAWGSKRGNFIVMPIFHPAAALHEPKSKALGHVAWAWQRVRRLKHRLEQGQSADLDFVRKLQGPAWVPPTDEKELEWDGQDISGDVDAIGLDTEGPPTDPWCLTFSTGHLHRLIWADNKRLLKRFKQELVRLRPLIRMHNSPWDLRVLKAMGLDLEKLGLKWTDTIYKAYNQFHEPRSLKALTVRWLRNPMVEYDDVVGPTDEALAREYLERLMVDGARWPPGEGRKWSIEKRAEAALKRDTKLRKAWKEWPAGLKKPVERYLGPMPEVDIEVVRTRVPRFREYAVRDAVVTNRLDPIMERRAIDSGTKSPADIDIAVTAAIARMEEVGIRVDLEKLGRVRKDFEGRLLELEGRIKKKLRVKDINIGSEDQIEFVLTDILGLELPKLTPSGKRFSVDGESLAIIKDEHEAIPDILQHKELRKLNNAYAKKLPKMVSEDGRYHPDINSISVVSGRFAEYVLTMPVSTEDGRRIRDCFEATDEEHLLGSSDFSQLELRLLAHESKDEKLTDIFRRGVDPHTQTAADLFGVPYKKVDHMKQRHPVKTINYAISYGAHGYTLYEQFKAEGIEGYDQDACDEVISDWYKLYKGVPPWIESVHEETRTNGYVRDMWGRVRWLPAISLPEGKWPMRWLRQEAERQAVNHKIQGAAAGLVKKVMSVFWEEGKPYFREVTGSEVELLLQVHDELIVEFLKKHGKLARTILVDCMKRFNGLFSVPMAAGWKQAQSWGGLK